MQTQALSAGPRRPLSERFLVWKRKTRSPAATPIRTGKSISKLVETQQRTNVRRYNYRVKRRCQQHQHSIIIANWHSAPKGAATRQCRQKNRGQLSTAESSSPSVGPFLGQEASRHQSWQHHQTRQEDLARRFLKPIASSSYSSSSRG